ncbi:heme utilization protein [Pseudomonas sp. LS1212]|uniref:heme utilization protein n=1 Tax=Pseudomonas sp. LS1212 TaxID=2972478 RepID=UPI00215CD790|nr:heme utilization protein [Pseudomonas sp. LS1212]UVJ45883.1 heme utilization protein [Pseudomonas sp. LS1212]
MKPTMALKPLVFALAAVMAVAVQADDHNDRHNKHHHKHHLLKLFINAGATAKVTDEQNSDYNFVLNQGTRNTAKVSNSASDSNGNMGLNAAAGALNQQDNASAIAVADERFIFGSAKATSYVNQYSNDNKSVNHSTRNRATLEDSGNYSSGNIGMNVAAGDFNQQKNNMAIAVSGGRVATATSDADQYSGGNRVINKADRDFKVVTLRSRFHAEGTYKGKGSGFVIDDDKKHDGWGHKKDKDPLYFTESGTFELSGVASKEVLVKTGWINPVVNRATLSGSLNGASGNVGANVAAGAGNQQSNSLSIASGCNACTGL